MQSFVSLFSTLLLLTTGLQVSAQEAVADCTSVSTHILPTVTNTIDLPTSTLLGRDDAPGSTKAGATTLTSVTHSNNPQPTSKPATSSSAAASVASQEPSGTESPVTASASDLQRRSVLQLSALIAVVGSVLVV